MIKWGRDFHPAPIVILNDGVMLYASFLFSGLLMFLTILLAI